MTGHVLVTGGCGFIGRHVCRGLVDAGYRVTVLDDLSSGDRSALPPEATLCPGDIRDRAAVASAVRGAGAVIHLAAISSVEACALNRPDTQSVNVTGTETVLSASGSRPVVFASSAAVYGDQPVTPIPETAELAPISPYAQDKVAGEALLRRFSRTTGQRSVAVRPFNVFGPGQAPDSAYSGVITLFSRRALSGQPVTINGDGGATRDFISVYDVARGMLAALRFAQTMPPGQVETVNLCRGEAISVLDLAELIGGLAGSDKAPVFRRARHGDIRHSHGDPSHALERLGFRAEVPLADGLAELLTSCASPA